jgi:riboflavin biosynthesis pyrimidine reductase
VRTPAYIDPSRAFLYAEFRRRVLNKASDPLNVIVTGSGCLDLSEPTFHTPGLETVVVTTEQGARRLRADHGPRLAVTQVRSVGDSPIVPPPALVELLRREFDVRLLLHEGGPTLLGGFLADRLLDEIFLTVAPQVAGRDQARLRPGLVDRAAFGPERAPWFDLLSVKRSGDHLFLRLSTREASRSA